ncbi:MAG: hypothetical protein GVY05_02110 [Bacteroidetes bacterium]|jgi:hypothetical protein|nr:hypothetical protein [Bacteroidota bacterium]
MNKKLQLERAILRSEAAYALYISQKKYHQALHIYKANLRVYELLLEYAEFCSSSNLNLVFEYIFHLEDWFVQFKNQEKEVTSLEDLFVFSRLLNGIPYPKTFKQLLK